jgi:ATP-dependent DNA helicase RecG
MEEQFPGWADAALTQNLPRLAAASETQAVEFKHEFPKHAGDLAKEIAAFATSNAGTILLGLEDSGEIVGLRDALEDAGRRALRTRLEGIFNLIKPTIAPGIRFAIFEDKAVAAIDVPKGSQPIYYANSIPYHRLLTAARPMAPEDVIEAVLAWSAERSGEASAEAQFLGELAGFWARVDLTVSERQLEQLNPWAENLRWMAGHQADLARQFAASAPHELEALVEPLRKLATALEIIATERPMLGGTDIEVLGAIQDADQIVADVRARYLGPGRFSARAAQDERASIETQARLLTDLVERIAADPQGMSYKTVQSETSDRGEALFYAASLGIGTGGTAERDALRQIAEALRRIEKLRVYMDGGKSIKRVFEATCDCHERLQGWLASADT